MWETDIDQFDLCSQSSILLGSSEISVEYTKPTLPNAWLRTASGLSSVSAFSHPRRQSSVVHSADVHRMQPAAGRDECQGRIKGTPKPSAAATAAKAEQLRVQVKVWTTVPGTCVWLTDPRQAYLLTQRNT